MLRVMAAPDNTRNVASNEQRYTYEVFVPPSKLRGMDVIWAIFRDCDKQNHAILASIIKLISKVHTSISFNLPADQAAQMRIDYVRTLISQMEFVANN